MSEIVDMEFEALKAIYLDDISIEFNVKSDECLAEVLVDVYPKTGDNMDDQFVRLTLVIQIPKNYPNQCPTFEFKNVRGLTEERIQIIKYNIKSIFEEKIGETVVYDMIEKSRDVLTTLNFPVGNRCAICLYELTINDQIVRNECFHHLHCRCFADYVVSTQSQQTNSSDFNRKIVENISDIRIQCPVCRIELNSTNLKSYTDPNMYSMPYLSNKPLDNESVIIEEAKLNQKKFDKIYEKQLENGGIIDSEYHKNKFFLRISETNDQMTVS